MKGDETVNAQAVVPAGSDRSVAESTLALTQRGLALADSLASRDLASNTRFRVVHFPGDRSVGSLATSAEMTEVTDGDGASFPIGLSLLIQIGPLRSSRWDYFGEARGEVSVPIGVHLSLATYQATSLDWSPLATLGPDDVQSLRLWPISPEASSGGLRNISGLTGLRELEAAGVTNDELGHLRKLTALQSLSFWDPDITDAGLHHLSGLTEIRSLHLSDTGISDAGLNYLGVLTGLQNLSVSTTKVTVVPDLPNLRTLDLDRTHVTDEGMRNLSELHHLQGLGLGYTEVTDGGLGRLGGPERSSTLAPRRTSNQRCCVRASRRAYKSGRSQPDGHFYYWLRLESVKGFIRSKGS